ncbi:peptidase M23 [Ectothiorhodospiraceae bacterium BW-2]|nr:peptidase M23 [Ectothiorhodospiraceae bacterium BW-2]
MARVKANTLLLLLLLPLATAADLATDKKSREAELEQLRQEMQQLQQQQQQQQQRYSTTERELARTEQAISHSHRRLQQLQQQLSSQQQQLNRLQQQSEQQQQSLQQQQQLLARQLRAASMSGLSEPLKLLLNQESPQQLGRMLHYYRYFAEARTRTITALQQQLSQMNRLKAQLEKTRSANQQALQQQQQQQQQLQQQQQQRSQLLAELERQIDSTESRLQRLQQNEQQLQQVINQLGERLKKLAQQPRQRPFKSQQGRLPWPVEGRISHSFGSSRGLGNLKWNGVVIDAPNGSPVRAISGGRVVYADWLRGYGLLLIIDHGDSYMSLYGQNQTLFKEVGDSIQADEIVAEVGGSSAESRRGLYFEIRHKGNPVNPKSWCRKASSPR